MGRACVKTPARFHTDLFCSLFRALRLLGSEKVAKDGARADTMVCTTTAGVTHCEAPLRHYTITGTRLGNRTYFEDNKGRRWMMIEEGAWTTVMPRAVGEPER
jgi:hypothetical protein